MNAAKVQILPVRKPANSSSSSSESPSDPSTVKADSTEPHEKRKRTSKPKVRSGCVTCKIRRVKCDETKPNCNRCTTTGRKCDGYVVKPRKQRSDCTALTKVPSPTTDIDPAEMRALWFYHENTAPALASYFDADFWSRLVFQMSYAEPSVRHAMIALGALHEYREQGLKVSAATEDAMSARLESPQALTKVSGGDHFALAQYNKAILFLSKRMNSEVSAIEVALLACILFICIEFLRGDFEPAFNHFRSGMTIALSSLSNKGSSTAAASLIRVKTHILPFFNRIELLSNLFGSEASWAYPVQLLQAVPDDFQTMREARDSIIHILNYCLRFIKFMKWRRYNRLVLPDHYERQSELLRQLDAWASTLDKLILRETITDRDLDAAKTLRIHHIVGKLWVARCLEGEESTSDTAMSDFETALSLAEAIHSVAGTGEQRQTSNSSTFVFDMEIVSPVYYLATKCRHPVLRRRAIDLLKRTERREGLWDSNMAAAVASRSMEWEERNLTTLDGSELPAEKDRVHNIIIASEIGTNPRKRTLTFYTKPSGVYGDWKTWKEEIIA